MNTKGMKPGDVVEISDDEAGGALKLEKLVATTPNSITVAETRTHHERSFGVTKVVRHFPNGLMAF